jgi:hypothetical protein
LTIGYDGGQYGVTPGSSDATAALSTAIPVGNQTLTPTINYTVISKARRPAAENQLWLSFNLAGVL